MGLELALSRLVAGAALLWAAVYLNEFNIVEGLGVVALLSAGVALFFSFKAPELAPERRLSLLVAIPAGALAAAQQIHCCTTWGLAEGRAAPRYVPSHG